MSKWEFEPTVPDPEDIAAAASSLGQPEPVSFEMDMTFTYDPRSEAEHEEERAELLRALFETAPPPTLISKSEDGVGSYRVLDIEPDDDGLGFSLSVEPI